MRADADCLSVRLIRKGEYDEDFERHQNQETAVVKRLNGEGAVKAQNYGYGNYRRNFCLCPQSGSAGRPYRSDGGGFELSLRKADASSIIVEG